MKKLSIILVIALLVSSTTFAFAGSPKGNHGKSVKTQQEAKQEVKKAKQEVKQEIKKAKSELKLQKLKIKSELKVAVANGDKELELKLKTQLKGNVQERKQLVLQIYTDEELSALNEATKKIKASDSKLKVLDVDSILSDGSNFKFDTPPVIKGNRTLIPVRAITEGFGADVSWDQETKQVTITKDQTTIVLTLGSNVALVDDNEVQLNTDANTINNRTYVPMRFIMETFNKKVTYDDGTIEVEEPDSEETVDEQTTSGTAIETLDPIEQTATEGAIETSTPDEITTSDSAI